MKIGPTHDLSVLITYWQKPPLIAHGDAVELVVEFLFLLILCICRQQRSGESTHLHRLT